MEDFKKFTDFIAAMKKRNPTTASHAMAQGFSDALLQADTRVVVPPKSKPSDILGMTTTTSVGAGAVGHEIPHRISTAWVDDLIKQPPTIKHLGRPKAKHD